MELRGLREQQLAGLKRLLSLDLPAEAGDVLLATASILAEAATAEADLAETYVDDAAVAGADATARAAAQKQAGELGASSRGFWQAAVRAVRRALDLPLADASRAEALHLLAEALESTGDTAGAADAYARLAALSPAAPRGRAAAFRLGERALEQGRADEALPLFTTAAGLGAGKPSPGDALSYLARDKIGWCQMQRNALEPALATFEALLRDLGKQGAVSPLRGQVAADYVYALSQLKGYAEAKTHLETAWGEPEARRFRVRLADGYWRDHRHADALLASQELLARTRTPGLGARLRARIAASLDALGRQEEAWQSLASLLQILPEPRPGAPVQPAVAEAREQAASLGRRLLLSRHDRLLELHDGDLGPPPAAAQPGEAKQAVELLRRYLALFPDAPDPWPLQLALADLLYRTGELEEAAREFEQVLAAPEAQELALDAARGAALALGARLGGMAATDAARREVAARLAELARRQLQRFGHGELAEQLRLERARALEALDRRPEALDELKQVAAGGGALALDAAEAVLRLRRDAGDWTGLAAAAAEFRERQGLGDPAFKERMEAIRCKSGLNLARARRDTDPPAGPAPRELSQRLVEYATANPGCSEAPPVLLEAGRGLKEASSPWRARAAYEQLLERHPHSPEAEQAPLELAALCEASADLDAAAAHYLQAAERTACPAKATLVLRAAALREARGGDEAALALRRDLFRQCPGEARAPAALLEAGREALALGDPARAERSFNALLALKSKAADLELAARLHLEAISLGRGKTDTLELEGLLAEYGSARARGPESARAAAGAVAAAVAALSAEVAALADHGAGVRKPELARLAELTAALESWAATAKSSPAEDEAKAAALVQAAEGLQRAAGLMGELASAQDAAPALARDAARMRDELAKGAAGLAADALRLGGRSDGWRLKALLLQARPEERATWQALAAHLVPASQGLQLPLPWLPPGKVPAGGKP